MIRNLFQYSVLTITLLAFIQVTAQTSNLKIADSLYTLGNYTEAIKAYEKITTTEPYVLLQIAKAHKAKGTYPDALRYYERVIRMHPNLTSAKLEYARLLFNTKKLQKADSVFTDLAESNPNNPDINYRLGLVKKKLEDSTAIAYFEKAFQLDTTHQKSCFEIAKHYLKQRKYDKVEGIANLGLQSYDENPELINILAQNFLLREYYERAIPYFEKLILIGHQNEYVHTSLALCYEKDYELEKAVTQYLEALKYNDKVAIRYTKLANVYSSMGKYEEALENYKKALSLNDLPIEMDLMNIASAYRQLEDYPNAIKYAKHAIKENPKNQIANYRLATYYDAYYKDPKAKLKQYELFLKKYDTNNDEASVFFKSLAEKRITQLEEEIKTNTKNTQRQ